MSYYFAYGSNLDKNQIKERCPESKLIDKYVLKNYKLAFTVFSKKRNCGCADIIKSNGDEVWGLVYKLTENDLKEMDRYEGHPKHYRRFTVNLTDESGRELQVQTYEVVKKESEHQKPSNEYIDILLKAAEEYNFPDSYRNTLSLFEII